MALSKITATDVINQYGAYYIDGEGSESDILTQIKQPTVTPLEATTMVTDSTYKKMVVTDLGEVVQAYQDEFTGKGEATFVPNPVELFKLKIDWKGYPDKLTDSYLGFLTNMNEKDRRNWPFVRWFIEVLLVKQSQNDRELKSYGKGSFVAPTSGTAGTALQAMDGIIKLARNAVNNGGVTLTLDNPITAANAFDSIEALSDQLPDIWERSQVKILCDPAIVRMYLRDDRATNGQNNNYQGENLMVQFSDIMGGGERIVPLPCMRGTGDVIAVIDSNFMHWRGAGMGSGFEIERVDRQVKIYTDWYEGFHFGVNELVAYYNGANSTSASASV